jgi:hypothetical protein
MPRLQRPKTNIVSDHAASRLYLKPSHPSRVGRNMTKSISGGTYAFKGVRGKNGGVSSAGGRLQKHHVGYGSWPCKNAATRDDDRINVLPNRV